VRREATRPGSPVSIRPVEKVAGGAVHVVQDVLLGAP